MNLDADLTARGDSAFGLISSLAGTAKIAMRDGVVKGFDLPAVSRRLREISNPFDLLTLGDLFSGGQSKVDLLDGTFKIDEGVIRTYDLALVAPAGAGFATGGADIAHWTIYTKAEFHLTELLDAPPVVLVFTEALDAPIPTIYDDALRDWVIRRGLRPGGEAEARGGGKAHSGAETRRGAKTRRAATRHARRARRQGHHARAARRSGALGAQGVQHEDADRGGQIAVARAVDLGDERVHRFSARLRDVAKRGPELGLDRHAGAMAVDHHRAALQRHR